MSGGNECSDVDAVQIGKDDLILIYTPCTGYISGCKQSGGGDG